MSGSLQNTRRKPRSSASFWSGLPGVGDRDELRPVPARLLEEVAEVRQRLDRPARLRRDEEERLREVDAALELGHRAGVGRVEHVQPQPVLERAERAPDHLGPEARAAHAEQRAVGEAVALHLLGPRLEVGRLLEHRLARSSASRAGRPPRARRPRPRACRPCARCAGRRRPTSPRAPSRRSPARGRPGSSS